MPRKSIAIVAMSSPRTFPIRDDSQGDAQYCEQQQLTNLVHGI
jgi:hypothetical protein